MHMQTCLPGQTDAEFPSPQRHTMYPGLGEWSTKVSPYCQHRRQGGKRAKVQWSSSPEPVSWGCGEGEALVSEVQAEVLRLFSLYWILCLFCCWEWECFIPEHFTSVEQ